jgi:hypothetical protein
LEARLRTRAAPKAYRLRLVDLPHLQRQLQSGSMRCQPCLSCTCSDNQVVTVSRLTPVRFGRTSLLPFLPFLPLLKIRTQTPTGTRVMEDFDPLLPGRPPVVWSNHESKFETTPLRRSRASRVAGPFASAPPPTLSCTRRGPSRRSESVRHRRHPHGPAVTYPGARDYSHGMMWR